MNRTDLTNRLKVVIKKVVPDADAILYGSEARGEAKKNSDIDVLFWWIRIIYPHKSYYMVLTC